MEHRELSQLRQGTLLKRKLEAAEVELDKLRKSRDAAEKNQFEAAGCASHGSADFRQEQAADRSTDLQERLLAACRKRSRLGREVQSWRRCTEELFRRGDDGSVAGTLGSDARVELQNFSARTEALQANTEDIRSRIAELEKIAVTSKVQCDNLQSRNAELADAIQHSRSALARAQHDAALELQHQKHVQDEVRALHASRNGSQPQCSSNRRS